MHRDSGQVPAAKLERAGIGDTRGGDVLHLGPSPQVRSNCSNMSKPIDCHRCKHYYVTWDKQFPHGCRAMKFKSKEFPSRVVVSSSGIPCLLFQTGDRGGKMGGPSPTPVRDQS
jgi:hypothetical protein